MNNRGRSHKTKQTGFTIIELTIATTVSAVMLLMATFGVIQISRAYNKGLTESKVQSVTQSAVDTIAQDIQFGAGTLDLPALASQTGQYAYCISGKHRYSVITGHELNDNLNSSTQSKHVLVLDSPNSCT